MTRETSQESQGGPKKFLYTGPKKSPSLFEDDNQHQQQQFTFSPLGQQPTGLSSDFDVGNVWSMRKNITTTGTQAQSQPQTRVVQVDCGTRNVNKNFYSRYGSHTGNDKHDKEFDFGSNSLTSRKKDPTQLSSQQKTFSYSHSNSGVSNSSAQIPSKSPPSGTGLPPSGTYGTQVAPSTNTYGTQVAPPTNTYGTQVVPPSNTYGIQVAPSTNTYGTQVAPSTNTYGTTWMPSSGAMQAPPSGPLDFKPSSGTYGWQQNSMANYATQQNNDNTDIDLLGSYSRDPNSVMQKSDLQSKATFRSGNSYGQPQNSGFGRSDNMLNGGRYNNSQLNNSNGQNDNLPF